MRAETRRVRLTDAGIRKLRPARTEYIVWDSRVADLGVRVRPSGHRSFVWHGAVNGVARRITIGPVSLKTMDEARSECLALQNGTGLQVTGDRRAVPLFRDFVTNEWRPALERRWRPSRRRYVDLVLTRQLLPTFGTKQPDRIRRADVERWFDDYSRTAPGGANMALDLLRQIMKAASAAGHVDGDPTQGVKKNPRPKFTRFLSAEEIERLHSALGRLVKQRPARQAQADVIRLLLLTGCRKGEILKLKWSEVDGDALRLSDAKTGPRTVWLSEAAQGIIARQTRTGSPYVFPSPRDPTRPLFDVLAFWHRARKEAGIDNLRVHDLRHTVASQAVANGVPLPTVARMLGHSGPTMTLRYAHVSDREVEAAAERIGKAIVTVMTGGLVNDRSTP